MLIDPRQGDLEDDASSPKRHSIMALAGSLLVEVSIPKLALAWLLLLIVPALALGTAPLVATAWVRAVWGTIAAPFAGIGPGLVLLAALGAAWLGGRRLVRLAEKSFWSLNSLAVEPGYVACREILRHAAERLMPELARENLGTLRATSAMVSAILLLLLALALLLVAWPSSRWLGTVADLTTPDVLIATAFANSAVLVAAYLGSAAIVSDAVMTQPRDLERFDRADQACRLWRVAHLSDLHLVAERYGFRIESGRLGPRGNERVRATLDRLAAVHAADPLDLVLVTGDLTDAGLSAEWAECLDALARQPELAARILVLPGNHDLNVVDRANPARLDLPMSPTRDLRKLRPLSAMDALQGDRVRVVDRERACLGATLREILHPHAADLAAFADTGTPSVAARLAGLWATLFPLVMPPDDADGLGVILLNSNADTHFSFTNALGLVPEEQLRALDVAANAMPRAVWIVALHHHLVEYPRPAKALSERIGTALINGNRVLRSLRRLAPRIVLMHGHRHIDWIGTADGLRIVSAPSPVMAPAASVSTHFYVHTLARTDGRPLLLLPPDRVTVER